MTNIHIGIRVTLTLTPPVETPAGTPAGTPTGTPAGTSMAMTGVIEISMIVKAYTVQQQVSPAIITWNYRNSMVTDREDDFLNFLRRF